MAKVKTSAEQVDCAISRICVFPIETFSVNNVNKYIRTYSELMFQNFILSPRPKKISFLHHRGTTAVAMCCQIKIEYDIINIQSLVSIKNFKWDQQFLQ